MIRELVPRKHWPALGDGCHTIWSSAAADSAAPVGCDGLRLLKEAGRCRVDRPRASLHAALRAETGSGPPLLPAAGGTWARRARGTSCLPPARRASCIAQVPAARPPEMCSRL